MQKQLAIIVTFISLLISITSSAHTHNNTKTTLSLTEEETSWLQSHPHIRISFDSHFPPYSFLNNNGELEGLAVDIFGLIQSRTGIDFTISPPQEWKAIYSAAQQKQVDVVATMVKRPERLTWFNFTEPYLHKSLVIVARSNDRRITRRDDIANSTVALVKGYQYISRLLDEYPSIKPLYVDTMLEALNAVSVGDADATLTFLGGAHYYRNKYVLANLDYAAVYDINNSNESIAIRKDWPELRQILNKALESIPESEMQRLRDKWLPTDYMANLVDIDYTDDELEWLKRKYTIRLGVDPEFAPFEFIENGDYKGFASDYIELLKQRLNLDIEIVPNLSWKQVIEKAKTGEIDLLAAVGITQERQQFLNYTPAYMQFHRVIVTREDMPFIAGLADLEGKKIAVQENSSHHGYLAENTKINPILYSNLQESLLAVSGGEADAFVGNVAAITYWIRKLNLSNLKIAAPVSTDVQTLHFATRKDWPELRSILEKNLKEISPQHKKRISEKWLSVHYEQPIAEFINRELIAGTALLLLAFLLWNRSLKQQVSKQTSRLEFAAHYDKLTALPNRFLIIDRLKQFIAESNLQNQKIALFSIDIKEFKKINDAYGHTSGDSLIKQVAERLRDTLNPQDSVGRLGGDQFLVIHKCFSDATDIALTAENLLSKLSEPYLLESEQISLNMSIGIAICPDDSENGETLLHHADSATHYVKEQLNGGFSFYTEGLTQELSRKLELERCMHNALARDELEVHYQPKVDAKTRRIVSFEALLRWKSSELGNISPLEFIPLAEKNDLIIPFGEFVLKKSIKTLADWQQRYQQPFSMAINLSPIQFKNQALIPLIEELTDHYNLERKNIEFEITEGVLLDEHNNIEEKLKLLENSGVTLSMDDFGTGYSSMNYLRKYKFDTLKIDRAFINDVNADSSSHQLVAATIAMAHGLGMQVVAEGVETEEQYTTLVELNCDLLQGWLFSKALTANDVELLLNTSFLTPSS